MIPAGGASGSHRHPIGHIASPRRWTAPAGLLNVPAMQVSEPHAKPLGSLIFFSRWLQAPLYLGLIVAQGVYVFRFVIELWHLVTHATDLSFKEEQIMIAVLTLIDIVMIANLLIMVIVGGYETFVSRLKLDGHPDQPEWLSHVNAGVLKVKLATALIGISSIHLLKTFIDVTSNDKLTDRVVMWQVIIHMAFIVSAFMLAWTDRITTRTSTELAHK
jgi:uncharacterized protein (TIGR00645 family)